MSLLLVKNNKNIIFMIIIMIIIIIILNCNIKNKNQENIIKIFAATSAGPALQEVRTKLIKNFSISLNIASSSTISTQIKNGATCDFVLLADQKWMNYLRRENKIINNLKLNFLSSSLALIAPKNKKFSLKNGLLSLNLSFNKKIALANPDFVPAGRYARKSLKSIGAFKKLKSKFLLASDARSALLLVENEEASSGIVYYTDAKSSKNISIISKIPNLVDNPIIYPFAKCKKLNKISSFNLNVFLNNFHNIAKKIFTNYGFRYLNKNEFIF